VTVPAEGVITIDNAVEVIYPDPASFVVPEALVAYTPSVE